MPKDRYYSGIDVGTSYIKTVLIDSDKKLVSSFIERTSPDLKKSITNAFDGLLHKSNVPRQSNDRIIATGFGRRNVQFATDVKTEISCHAKGAYYYFPKKITIIDIGGQDTKIIKVDEKGKLLNFRMNRKCAAGTGAFLEEISHKLDISINDMNELGLKSKKDVALSSFCTVFASTEILTRIKEGEKIEDMVKSAYESVAKRVIEMDTLEGTIVVSGGVIAYNNILIKILKKYVGDNIYVPPNPQLIGAIGAALYALETNI